MRAARRAWDELWDRYSASDPGLIRLLNALTTVGAILLTLSVLAGLGAAVTLLVAGAMSGMVASFAVSDPTPREQRTTLALGYLVALAVVGLGAELYRYRVASDLVFLVLIFTAVYVRRFGPRGTGTGLIGFQLFFVSQFTRTTPAVLPQMYGAITVAFCSAALVRFGLVRATPQRTLQRLRRAFRARLADLVDALSEVVGAAPGSRVEAQAAQRLHTRTARLHQCALMIQARLENGAADPRGASLIQRRVAEAEIAAERLSVLLLRALLQQPRTQDITLGLHLPMMLPVAPAPGAGDRRDRPEAVDETGPLPRDLGALRRLVVRQLPGEPVGPVPGDATERLLKYRDGVGLPDAEPADQDVYRAMGELARAVLGLRLVLDASADPEPDDPPSPDPVPGTGRGDESETTRSTEEMEAEDLSLQADEEGGEDRTGLRRPTTRAAFQVTAGSALAILGGELLSPQRWYWAVLTCWVVFLNTSSTGEILVKGYRRLAGTIGGVVAGIGLAELVGGNTWVAFALVILFIFGMFFTAPLSYMLMSFFVTAMLGLLYTLLHTYSTSVLLLRIEETLLGAACGLIAAVLILPTDTRSRTDDLLLGVFERLRATLSLSVAALSGHAPEGELLDSARELDTSLDALRGSLQPLTHPASPLRNRRRQARYVLGLLETCAYHARSLAATAGFVPTVLSGDPRLKEVGEQLDANLAVLAEFVRSEGRTRGRLTSAAAGLKPTASPAPPGPRDDVVTARVLRHLQRLDENILALGRPLGLGTASARRSGSAQRTGGAQRTRS
ncbi:FUSC family protein [Streptacidiphilus carbonis]|uniref:FUSC family protein n=1 Tax=Streptacidiphilus carbonis TaxID=105422 RepID=UPI0005AB1A99|nr:FUSC family protein [Streptacidiphilus carbonis]